jgi:hypothetical protein
MTFFIKEGQESKTWSCLGVGTSGRGAHKERVWEVNVVEYYALMNENGK